MWVAAQGPVAVAQAQTAPVDKDWSLEVPAVQRIAVVQ